VRRESQPADLCEGGARYVRLVGLPRDRTLVLRAAVPSDQTVLDEMLWMAHTWRERPHPPCPTRLPDGTREYAASFGRTGDHGVIAQRGQRVAGAAWWRHRTAANPGYGYIADDIPELTVGVRPEYRRQGVASAMLSWLEAEAARLGIRALSLSVEHDNPARPLSRKAGYSPAGGDEGALTLCLHHSDL